MDAVRTFLENQSLFALFLTIALGYLIGEINIKGVALGSGAVLFVGLAIGAFAPKSAPPPLLGTLGLLLFLYGIGIQYGAQFFRGLTSREGMKANIAACVGVIVAGLVACGFIHFGIKLADALGMFAGSGTSTASLQVAIASMKSNDAAVAYSISYPFGVAGPILLIYLLNVALKVKIQKPPAKILETAEIALRNAGLIGLRLSELSSRLPSGVAIAAVRRAHHNQLPAADLTLRADDVLLATSTDRRLLEEAAALCGEMQPGRMTSHREDLDYMRVFASNPAVVGMALGDIRFPDGVNCAIAHVRRGDADMLSTPDLILEAGDRVGLLVNRAHQATMRTFFGDSIKGTADLSFICLGIGAALGLLAGAIPLPIPGLGAFSLGLAALLLVALCLGKARRNGPFVWVMPLSANLVLRNLGLTIFLAQVGISCGPKFVDTVGTAGPILLVFSIITVFVLVAVTAICCLWIFRLPFDTSIGVICGATGNPAILAFANRVAPTDQPDIMYAMIFPSMTIVKVLFVQIAISLAAG
ncbi:MULTISPECIES: TrkA C-terminal domain-containing protein [Caballeronia]|jgi:putative transport protein|uniref:aspartate-alanine antiporter-like transporter n=1 Tax=Caballeronia TaxID=1827195 RepID=UPI001589C955|nr:MULTISPECIES: TrkA C-terminal domain-containing protein [Caballeronia]MCG7400919.1 YidE/YbjL duplication [Caballeronia zhejiangensis]MCI1043423.1 YidE/YbjL duplication [Caballeronia zhejiangensis]MDR5767768.1 TrkA C-terminal domain-containing protein [Caballeronia sp. LZ028]MDR5796296.1 TrkA C-terminal domain-containing protein [Caballeronia sp. LZ008]